MEVETTLAIDLTQNEKNALDFLQRYPLNSSYNCTQYLSIKRALNVQQLQQAINTMQKQHGMLRCEFDLSNQQKIIKTGGQAPFFFTDLRSLGEAEQEQLIHQAARELKNHHFNPEQWPLYQVRLYQLQAEHFVIMVSASHCIIDGYAMMLYLLQVFKEMQSPSTQLTDDIELLQHVAKRQEENNTAAKSLCQTIKSQALAPLFHEQNHPCNNPYDSHSITLPLDNELIAKIENYRQQHHIGRGLFFQSLTQRTIAKHIKQDNFLLKNLDFNRHQRELHNLLCFMAQGRCQLVTQAQGDFHQLVKQNEDWNKQSKEQAIPYHQLKAELDEKQLPQVCFNYHHIQARGIVHYNFEFLALIEKQHMWNDEVKLIFDVFRIQKQMFLMISGIQSYFTGDELEKLSHCFMQQVNEVLTS